MQDTYERGKQRERKGRKGRKKREVIKTGSWTKES